jgi:hypothetical protein
MTPLTMRIVPDDHHCKHLSHRRHDDHLIKYNNNLVKPFTTVGADPFYAQTSGPRPPKEPGTFRDLGFLTTFVV